MDRKKVYQFITQNFLKAKLIIRNAENGKFSLFLHGNDKNQDVPSPKEFRVSHKENGVKEWSEFFVQTFIEQTPILFTSYFPQPTIEMGQRIILGNEQSIFEIEADVPLQQLLGKDFIVPIEQAKMESVKEAFQVSNASALVLTSRDVYRSRWEDKGEKVVYDYLKRLDSQGQEIIPESEKTLICQLLQALVSRADVETCISKTLFPHQHQYVYLLGDYAVITDSEQISMWLQEIMTKYTHDKVVSETSQKAAR